MSLWNQYIMPFLESGNMPTRRPMLSTDFESNVPNLYIVGDLAGAPVVKLAMEQGAHAAEVIAKRLAKPSGTGTDVIVIGAGASGLNAAMLLQDKGFRVVILEQRKLASTIEDFPEGKWIYDEPTAREKTGPLWLKQSTKEELLGEWHRQAEERKLDIRYGASVSGLERHKDSLTVVTMDGQRYDARKVILASGQRGTPRRLNCPGDDLDTVSHRLYSPKHYHDEKILVVGGGNSAIEAALALCDKNKVTLSYRAPQFTRVFSDNLRRIKEAMASGKVEVVFESEILRFSPGQYVMKTKAGEEKRDFDHAFILIGAELPTKFLKSLGIKLENEWEGNALAALGLVAATLYALSVFAGKVDGTHLLGLIGAVAGIATLIMLGLRGSRFAWLGVSFLVSYTVYGAKQSTGFELWPYTGWGNSMLSFGGRPWSFWYSFLYCVVMTVFGIQAMKRWGFDYKDKFQIWRYTSLLTFQWFFFFLLPEFLFRILVDNHALGALAKDPNFAANAWRSYGLVYAWPLFFYTFFDNPAEIWVIWGLLLSFVILPIFVLIHGKRYCTWICGCGGLAETLGDRWRHLAPKGRTAKAFEHMNIVVLASAVIVTLLVIGTNTYHFLAKPAAMGKDYYHLIADTWLVGIIPVTLYPFFGGKVWCRYWCPLAKMMEYFSAAFTRFKVSRFAIHANDKCIACGECTRNCQVGIDVMSYATMQKELNNANSCCIGCGICVTVCPMDVLYFAPVGAPVKLVQISKAA